MNLTIKKLTVIISVFALIYFLISNSLFIVNEGEQAVVTRFGRILPQNYTEAGLKFKVPLVDVEHIYPKKLLSWDGQADLLPTSDDKRVLLDTTARWRIADPKIFYAKLADIRDAFNKLDDIIDKRVRAVIGRFPMVEIVRSDNEMLTIANKKEKERRKLDVPSTIVIPEEDLAAHKARELEFGNSQTEPRNASVSGGVIKVAHGRLKLEREILEFSRREINPKSLGIELVDVLIRQVQYPDNVAAKAFERMASERKKRAAEQRSRGEGQKAYWLGRLQKEKQTVMALAEAKAAVIYREAYSQDPDFYRFWRAMDSYEATLSGMDKIFGTDMAYFDYLYSAQGSTKE